MVVAVVVAACEMDLTEIIDSGMTRGGERRNKITVGELLK